MRCKREEANKSVATPESASAKTGANEGNGEGQEAAAEEGYVEVKRWPSEVLVTDLNCAGFRLRKKKK